MEAAQSMLRMHPRGFLGGFPPSVIEKVPQIIDRPQFDHLYRLNIVRPADPTTYPNTVITDLYTRQLAGGLAATLLEFRKECLKEILSAFGTSRFDSWYLQQLSSPAFGENHMRFLDDTIGFIYGNRREMHPMTWAGLIDMEKNPGNLKPSKMAEDFFDFRSFDSLNSVRDNDRYELPGVIQSWCSRPGGFEDLLCTANILFGSY